MYWTKAMTRNLRCQLHRRNYYHNGMNVAALLSTLKNSMVKSTYQTMVPHIKPISMVKFPCFPWWILGTSCSVLSAHQTFGARCFDPEISIPSRRTKTPLITQIRLRRTNSSKFLLSLHFYPFFIYFFHCGNGLERQMTHNEPHWASEQNGAIVVEMGPAPEK